MNNILQKVVDVAAVAVLALLVAIGLHNGKPLVPEPMAAELPRVGQSVTLLGNDLGAGPIWAELQAMDRVRGEQMLPLLQNMHAGR